MADDQAPPAARLALSLPKGGGALRGIGETFTTNAATGTASLSVPIAASPGRAGFGPQLTITYDSGSGNGPFGLGWRLSLPMIARKTDKGLPRYADPDEDTFVLSGAEDLVPVLVRTGAEWRRDILPGGGILRVVHGTAYAIQRYRPRVEGPFSRIERWSNPRDAADTFWRSITRDNVTTWYGKTPESRVADPADATRIFEWRICESSDGHGNIVLYQYKREGSDDVEATLAHERHRDATTRSAQGYLKRVRYGNRTPYFPDLDGAVPVALPADWCFDLVFDYGEHDPASPTPADAGVWKSRPDPFSTHRAGFEVRTYRRCRRALMFHHFGANPAVGTDCLVRSTDFVYAPVETDPDQPPYSMLVSVGQTAYQRDGDGGYRSSAMPPLTFRYSSASIDAQVHDVSPEALENLPIGLDGAQFQWVDLDGEGTAGILTEQGSAWHYKANLSAGHAPTIDAARTASPRFAAVAVLDKPSTGRLVEAGQRLMDLSGDGQLDLVSLEGAAPGFFERTSEQAWASFAPFHALPAIDWQSPALRFVDLTGDGLPDLLITETEALWWHPSLGEEGFGEAQRVPQPGDDEGPRLLGAEATQSLFLADMSGDGLTDLVRIRNGDVCYWPNQGYGRFGPRVTMDGAPWFDGVEAFDGRRLRLADVDGSGTTDIIYLAADGAHIYLNCSGNSWTSRRTVPLPAVDAAASVTAVDLLGIGTTCLVWSSPLPGTAERAMRYVDLTGGRKPHLLTGFDNNLGAETVIHYAPSTSFYVADRMAGTPWITRLPFPVHVVERVESYDHISRNRFSTRYSYHHGYFNGREREFRGFGRVDRIDSEVLAALSATGDTPQPVNIEAASHVPPVLTRTWFHTGAFHDGVGIERALAREYYREGSDAAAGDAAAAILLADTVLPSGILLADGSRLAHEFPAEDLDEACRALRGLVLRQETYALDGSEAAGRPYRVAERNYTVEALQPRAGNRHGVFFAHPRESLELQYERALYRVNGDMLVAEDAPPPVTRAADPRVSHGVTLAVDAFGNVLQSVAIGYGRRYRDPAITAADQARQRTTLTTVVQSTYTVPVLGPDVYRAPLVADSRTFELLQCTPDGGAPGVTNLFRFEELRAKIDLASDGTHDVPFHDRAPAGLVAAEVYRRLIGRTRTLYRPDDLGASAGDPRALLAPGRLEPMALAGATFKLVFTPGLLDDTYRRDGVPLLPTPATVLGSRGADGGGYVDLDGDGHWWLPSGREFFSTGTPSIPGELVEARQHFFMTRRFEDAFGQAGLVEYDVHDLLATATIDAAGNRIEASNDYRVLMPALLTDANGNRSAVSFDVGGFVAGTAVMGKATEALGDGLTGFTPDLTQAEIDGFHDSADPHLLAPVLLGTATTRLVYDLHRFARTRAAAPGDAASWQPPFSATITRETHVADLSPGQQSAVQVTFGYSDGFGREIQRKIPAEPGPVVAGGPSVDPRWVGSGWTIFNNKGKPVRQYEPFFSPRTKGHQFEFASTAGVSPIALYDPLDRVVARLNANHTYEKTVFDPWWQESWDVNDTVLLDPSVDPDVSDYFARLQQADYLPTWRDARAGGGLGPHEQAAAAGAATHAGTPMLSWFDTLGRVFRTSVESGSGTMTSRFELDISGNRLAIVDPLGRLINEARYDLLRNRIRESSMDSGTSWTLTAVLGEAIRAWDARGHEFTTSYDALRRPAALAVRGADPAQSDPRTLPGPVVYERIEYGEGHVDAARLNLRGRVLRHLDTAGILENLAADPATGEVEAFDFKGNLRRSRRRFVADPTALVDWSAAAPALAPDLFDTATRYDALNRPVSTTAPDGSIVLPRYSRANLLDGVTVRLRGAAAATTIVADIVYNARGQRMRIDYGNGASTTYEYDPDVFRLTRLTTTRGGVAPAAQTVQDLGYVFDPSGNLTHLADDADIQNVVFFANQRVEPAASYRYDAAYRLIEASGREHVGLIGGAANPPAPGAYNDLPRRRLPHPGDGAAMATYRETYAYDLAGNLEELTHTGTLPVHPGWHRTYTYAETSLLEPARRGNRLTSSAVGGTGALVEPLTYDRRGNVTSMVHLPQMVWDFKDQLGATRRQAISPADAEGTAHAGERTFYVYDFSGQRTRKVTVSGTGVTLRERFYVGGFERYREYTAGATALERESLHLSDDRQRIAIVETTTADVTVPAVTLPRQAVRYQFGNQLGTACLELDEAGAVITYEEYYPFGGTSYQAGRSASEVSLKRYRYLGRERDDETGFYYNRARYYVPWLGRWSSPDPAGLVEGPNPYQYARNNPVTMSDPGGEDPDKDQVSIGPFAFRNIHAEASLNLSGSFTLNDLFSSNRSLTINTLNAGGKLSLTADTGLFGMSGRSTGIFNLDRLHLDHQLFSLDVSANASLSAGPFALDLQADATGTSVIERNISLSAPADSLRYTLDNFQGSANLFGRFFLRTGPINRALGAFSLTADSHGTSGTLGFRGYLGLPTLDPGRNINIARITGEGTFGPGGYELHGNFRLLLPPVAFATGRFSLSSAQGFSASGHYVGLQLGPLGLAPSFDPFALHRPPNFGASPGDSTDTMMSRQLSFPERRLTGPGRAVQTFSPGLSVGYSYLRYSQSGTTIFSAGFSPSASYTLHTLEQPSIPIPGAEKLLYGRSLSTPAGVYFGLSLTQTFSNP